MSLQDEQEEEEVLTEQEEEEEVLGIWNSLEDLRYVKNGQICTETYGEFFAFIAGEGEYVKAYLRKMVWGTHNNLLPDEEKHYALEAAFNGHVEFKHAVGSASKPAFDEMIAYLKEGKENARTLVLSGH